MRIVGITGGVDTHADIHVAAAVDRNGGLLGVESFPADRAGYEELLGWLVGFGEVEQVGVEGTGSWGVGLARFLQSHEVAVVEVDRPNRQTPKVDTVFVVFFSSKRNKGLRAEGIVFFLLWVKAFRFIF